MSHLTEFDRETKEARAERRRRTVEITSGPRSSVDFLTDKERDLLNRCVQLGLEISAGTLHTPRGDWQHGRVVRRASA